MPYAFTQDLPFTRDVYERFCAALPDETPQGLLVRVATETDTGVRLFDVWEDESAYEEYLRTAVQPIVTDGFFNGTGYEPPASEPPRQQQTVLDVWVGALHPERDGRPQLRNDPQ
jgi:hypothetical protein